MNKPGVIFSILGTLMTITFFYIINSLYSFNHIWFIYPAFCILWWPISLYYNNAKRYKEYSVVSCVLIIAFLITTNYTTSSSYPWFLYAIFPVIWWPITMLMGRKAGTVAYALFVSFCTIGYYGLLNYLLSPHYPWFIYPSFVVLWWPISLYYGKRSQFTKFSYAGSILIILFFATVNQITTPHTLWGIYPSVAVLWWPLSMHFTKKQDFYRFSVAASMLMILFFIIVNVITTPHTMWAIYPSFGIIWCPLCMYYKKSKNKMGL